MPNLALVLSGAVSLGSWEAGVLDELLFQLDRLNRKRPTDPFAIDVITGASAGAMTGALVARAVAIGINERRLLRDAWVNEIDIVRLLKDVPPNGLLAKRPILDIARRYLHPPDRAEPSSMAPARLLLGFTLTNMSGVDYRLSGSGRPGAAHADFVSTFHAERREFEVTEANRLEPQVWEDIREAAIASGNFPFAFAPHRLPSTPEAWPGHALAPFPPQFTYVDGGLFNNEPLGEAVRLARKLDASPDRPGLDPSRRFLLVDANLNGSRRDEGFSELASLRDAVARTLAVVLGESSALDWLKARRYNNEIEWRDDFLTLVAELVNYSDVFETAGFLATLERRADHIVEEKRALFPDRYPADYRADAVARTLVSHARLVEGMTPIRQRIFGTLAFLLNSVSGLDKKDRLNLHVIYATPGETAGDRMRAFAGFFSHEWRLHDYLIGRKRANEELPWVLEGRTGPYDREPGVDYSPRNLGDVDMDSAPRDSRIRLREAILTKVEAFAADVAIGPRWVRWLSGPVARWGIRRAVRAKLQRVLKL